VVTRCTQCRAGRRGAASIAPPRLPVSVKRVPGSGSCLGGLEVGVDEAGRGALAGPVVAAAVVAMAPDGDRALASRAPRCTCAMCARCGRRPGAQLEAGGSGPCDNAAGWCRDPGLSAGMDLDKGVVDSKLLSEPKREWMYELLTGHPHIHWGIAVVERERIDEVNILRATYEAMTTAVQELKQKLLHRRIGKVMVDGNRLPPELEALHPCEAVVGGDRKVFSIAAASILAKVTRDGIMKNLHKDYPEYGFGQHKGYGTADHFQALKMHGILDAHRRSYEPIKGYLRSGTWPSRGRSCVPRSPAHPDPLASGGGIGAPMLRRKVLVA